MAATHSVSSTRVLLQLMLHIPAYEATLRTRTAQAIHAQDLPSGGESPPALPVLAAAVTAGPVDPDHTRTILATMKRLPGSLDADTLISAEQSLVDFSMDLDADQFRKVALHLEETLSPDGPRDEREPLSKVEFHIGSRSSATGLTSITGKLDDLAVETLRTVIDSLSAPKPELDGIKDPRPAPMRRAHALIEALQLTLTHAELPQHAGARPQVVVTMNWDVLEQHVAHAVTDHGATLSPATTRRLLCDADVIPAVLSGDGEVLDLGRTTRTCNRATRRAIALHDRGCALPRMRPTAVLLRLSPHFFLAAVLRGNQLPERLPVVSVPPFRDSQE